jgi:hypothetical protein
MLNAKDPINVEAKHILSTRRVLTCPIVATRMELISALMELNVLIIAGPDVSVDVIRVLVKIVDGVLSVENTPFAGKTTGGGLLLKTPIDVDKLLKFPKMSVDMDDMARARLDVVLIFDPRGVESELRPA